jgi:hypothetical protein
MKRHFTATAISLLALALAFPAFPAAVRDPGGSSANTLTANDDGSTPAVGLGFSVNFFGSLSSTVFVNNNGNVTFTNPLSQFTPNGLATGVGQPIIAPYFADVDTRGTGSGLVTYGTGTITDASLGWNNSPVFAVEWPSVGYFSSETNKLNTFELLLVGRADTGAGNFDIEFNYNSILWETGDVSGGTNGLGGTSAAVGYSNGLSGSSNVFFQLAGSLAPGSLINGGVDALISHSLDSNVLGRYDFQVRGGAVVVPPTGAPEPASPILLISGCLFGVAVLLRRKTRPLL